MDKILTVQEAAEYKQVSDWTIYRILKNDEERLQWFPNAKKIGSGKQGRWALLLEDVEAWEPRSAGWQSSSE